MWHFNDIFYTSYTSKRFLDFVLISHKSMISLSNNADKSGHFVNLDFTEDF